MSPNAFNGARTHFYTYAYLWTRSYVWDARAQVLLIRLSPKQAWYIPWFLYTYDRCTWSTDGGGRCIRLGQVDNTVIFFESRCLTKRLSLLLYNTNIISLYLLLCPFAAVFDRIFYEITAIIVVSYRIK